MYYLCICVDCRGFSVCGGLYWYKYLFVFMKLLEFCSNNFSIFSYDRFWGFEVCNGWCDLCCLFNGILFCYILFYYVLLNFYI